MCIGWRARRAPPTARRCRRWWAGSQGRPARVVTSTYGEGPPMGKSRQIVMRLQSSPWASARSSWVAPAGIALSVTRRNRSCTPQCVTCLAAVHTPGSHRQHPRILPPPIHVAGAGAAPAAADAQDGGARLRRASAAVYPASDDARAGGCRATNGSAHSKTKSATRPGRARWKRRSASRSSPRSILGRFYLSRISNAAPRLCEIRLLAQAVCSARNSNV